MRILSADNGAVHEVFEGRAGLVECVHDVTDGIFALDVTFDVFAASGAVHALTDVTGFGLLGHGWEMASGSGVALRIRAAAVPLLEGIHELAARGVVPGGSKANLAWVTPQLRVAAGLAPTWPIVLADAQTNGGLLAAIDPARAAEVQASLRAAGVAAVEIGEVLPGDPPRIELA